MRKIRYFIIDTNTLISAFILPHSTARKALNIVRREGQIILSDATSNEFTNAFTRAKFDKYLSFEIRLKIIDDFKSLAIVTNPTVCIFDCRDPKDNKFLELAISESVECIITGDQDLLVMNPFKGIPILNASDFLRTYGKEATFMLNEPNEEYRTQQDHVLEGISQLNNEDSFGHKDAKKRFGYKQ